MNNLDPWAEVFDGIKRSELEAQVEIERQKTEQLRLRLRAKETRRAWLVKTISDGAFWVAIPAVSVLFIWGITSCELNNADEQRHLERLECLDRYEGEKLDACIHSVDMGDPNYGPNAE